MMNFHGSYRKEQVTFLLKPIALESIEDTALKEHLIQSGQRHYSEMLSPEKRPSAAYLDLFHAAHQANRQRMAADVLKLAALIRQQKKTVPTLVSLARAGTPVGAILQQVLSRWYGQHIAHYSISIIRDRGIDENALKAILAQGHASESLVFVDGWTGKGVINHALQDAVSQFNATHDCQLDGRLFVLTDLAGVTDCAASDEDYLIPSSILNASISGLVSRSILNEAIGEDDFHGCVYFEEFADCDLSQWFVDDVVALAQQIEQIQGIPKSTIGKQVTRYQQNQALMASCKQLYGVSDVNLIKPGIGEATRVFLRRLPERLLVKDLQEKSIAHLLWLAQEKNVAVELVDNLPYHAVAMIRSAQDA